MLNLLWFLADTLLDNLTVEEMLMYTAEMKNPVRDTLASKKAKVALVMEQLALTSCRSVKIGNALDRGISGAPLADASPLLPRVKRCSTPVRTGARPSWRARLKQT